jgi:hypothetical protein
METVLSTANSSKSYQAMNRMTATTPRGTVMIHPMATNHRGSRRL